VLRTCPAAARHAAALGDREGERADSITILLRAPPLAVTFARSFEGEHAQPGWQRADHHLYLARLLSVDQ
jgi:hypothetical protein